MKRTLFFRHALISILAASMAAQNALAAAPIIALGPGFNANVGAHVAGFDPHGAPALPSALAAWRTQFAQQPTPELGLILAAASQPAATVESSLRGTDLPAATAKQLVDLSALVQSRAGDPAVTEELDRIRAAQNATPKTGQVSELVETVLKSWKSPAAAPVADVAPTPASGEWQQTLHGPRPLVNFLNVKLPAIAMPSLGDVISDLWGKAHDAAPAIIQANYNFDDMDIARSIVAKAKAGQKQVLVGDYSNWFPERLSQANHGGQHQERTEAMRLILANLGPNLELYILKGFESFGINHNKFTVFYGPNGEKLLQSGSFNYTKSSQNNHWENVTFTDEAERIAYFESYFQWLKRRARAYSPDLQPEEPVLDPKDPIPQPPARGISFHDVPFPEASFSPNGGTEDWLVKAESLVRRGLDILMFAPFPTSKMSEQILSLLKKGIPVRMVADAGQVQHAAPIVPLIKAGMELRVIKGPDVEVHHDPVNLHSKQHEKVMIFDGRTQQGATSDGLVKVGDSLNISRNALSNNFENTQLWSGWLVTFMQNHFDYVHNLAHPVDEAVVQQLAKANADWMTEEGRQSPWAGKPSSPRTPTNAQLPAAFIGGAGMAMSAATGAAIGWFAGRWIGNFIHARLADDPSRPLIYSVCGAIIGALATIIFIAA